MTACFCFIFNFQLQKWNLAIKIIHGIFVWVKCATNFLWIWVWFWFMRWVLITNICTSDYRPRCLLPKAPVLYYILIAKKLPICRFATSCLPISIKKKCCTLINLFLYMDFQLINNYTIIKTSSGCSKLIENGCRKVSVNEAI